MIELCLFNVWDEVEGVEEFWIVYWCVYVDGGEEEVGFLVVLKFIIYFDIFDF